PAQGIVLSNLVGVLCFFVVAALTGDFAVPSEHGSVDGRGRRTSVRSWPIRKFPCEPERRSESNAPVIQLNVVVTLVLSIIFLREPCTILPDHCQHVQPNAERATCPAHNRRIERGASDGRRPRRRSSYRKDAFAPALP